MEFPLNISKENIIVNAAHRYLSTDDASSKPNDHLNFFNENLGQPSLSIWPRPPDPIYSSNYNHKNLIPMISNQTSDSLNQNSDIAQNRQIYSSATYVISSNYPFMGTNSSSNTDTFMESMNSVTKTNKLHMTHNTSISKSPEGKFDSFYDFGANTIWNETIVNGELTNRNKGCEASFDRKMCESQPYNMLAQEGVKNAAREIMNQHEDQNMVKESKSSKKGNIVKGKWAESEDRKLKELVELYGSKNWRMIAKKVEGREGKQCRERWHNHLRPNIKKDVWTEEEDQILIKAHEVVGTKWNEIAQRLPGRSENTIKNHWNTTKRRMQKQSDKSVIPFDNNILENYIKNVIVNKDELPKAIETNKKTANTKDDDDYKDMFYEEMSCSLDARTHTVKPLVDVSAISANVPTPETIIWEDYTTELCEPMNYTELLME